MLPPAFSIRPKELHFVCPVEDHGADLPETNGKINAVSKSVAPDSILLDPSAMSLLFLMRHPLFSRCFLKANLADKMTDSDEREQQIRDGVLSRFVFGDCLLF